MTDTDGKATAYAYDQLNQLVRVDDQKAGVSTTYRYDVGGNIAEKKTYDYTTGTLGAETGSVSYSYGDSGWKDLLTSYDGQAITSDEIGNPLSYRDGMEFTWEGHQLQAVSAGGKDISYAYNSDGIRTGKTVDGVTTSYLLDGSTVIAQKTGDDVLWFLYDSDGTRVGFTYNGAAYYYMTNAQGDVTGIVDSSVNSVVEYSYDAWGKLLTMTGSMADTVGKINPYLYRGYYYDAETGFYLTGTRYYDPIVGRFIIADCMVKTPGNSVLGTNMYAYCENNPVNRSDPTGQWFGLDDLIAGAVGAVVGLASQLVSDVVTSACSGSWQFSSWQTYVGAGVGGAIGGVTTLYAGPVVGAAVGAGSATLIGQTLENVTGGKKRTVAQIAKNTAVDATIGAVVSRVIPVKVSGITAGRNSMDAVFKSGLTKLGNQTASRMSAKVIGKGVASGFVSDIGLASGMGAKSFFESSWEMYNQKPTPTGPCYWCAP